MPDDFDYVIVGSGIGGLMLATLLARSGRRVCVLERHDRPGGYGHSFFRQGYTFCAELHYLWNCGRDQDVGHLLNYLGLQDEILFSQLDPDGYEHFRFPGFRYELCQGFDRNVENLAARYPEYREPLKKYFKVISRINGEVYRLPLDFGPDTLIRHPFRFRNILRYRNWTTRDLFDRLSLPLPLQSILAGQMGDIAVPPGQASLIVQAMVTCGYDAGAYVPQRGFAHLFDQLVQFIQRQPGCQVLLKHWVAQLRQAGNRIVAAETKQGQAIHGQRFVFNGDPALLPGLLEQPLPADYRKRLSYEYSPGSFTLYLGVRGLDLADYGFGNWNVWHYQHDDLDQVYAEQIEQRNLSNPFLFMSTPTLHQKTVRLEPDDCQQLVVCTGANFDHFAEFRRTGRAAYLAEKDRVTQLVLDQIERHYIPNLRAHLDLVVAGSPLTNERFLLAPRGNTYGAHLTPQRLQSGHIDCHTPLDNLWLTGATATSPSFAGGTHWAILLYEYLSGDKLRRE